METLNLRLEGDPKELTIRTGEAEAVKHEKSISITGTLGAPHAFFTGKKDITTPDKIHLLIYNAEGKLKLVMGDRDPWTTHEIVGSLTKDSVLQSFGINASKMWSVRDFVKHIKATKYYFANAEEHKILVEKLQKWSVRVEKVIVDHNDHKGNVNFQLEQKVKEVEGFVDRFTLNIPIFQGYAKLKFTVEIGFEPKNTTVDLFLISDELFELEISNREKLIAEEVGKFADTDFSKIVIS